MTHGDLLVASHCLIVGWVHGYIHKLHTVTMPLPPSSGWTSIAMSFLKFSILLQDPN
jgi:hypothetical protein